MDRKNEILPCKYGTGKLYIRTFWCYQRSLCRNGEKGNSLTNLSVYCVNRKDRIQNFGLGKPTASSFFESRNATVNKSTHGNSPVNPKKISIHLTRCHRKQKKAKYELIRRINYFHKLQKRVRHSSDIWWYVKKTGDASFKVRYLMDYRNPSTGYDKLINSHLVFHFCQTTFKIQLGVIL